MKFKLLAIIAFVAITLSSCHWFNSKSDSQSLIGTWKLDSISTTKDTSEIGLLLLAIAMQKDSAQYKLTKDSIYYTGEDPIAYTVNKEKTEITLNDALNTKYNIQLLNDSLLQLQTKDSTSIFLTRVK